MRYFLFLLVGACALYGSQQSILNEFPSSVEQVTKYTSDALKDFDENFAEFIGQPLDQVNFDKTIVKWNDIVELLVSKGVVLSFLPLTIESSDVIAKGEEEAKRIMHKLYTAMQNPKALSVVLQFIKNTLEKPKSATPFELYLINSMLKSMEKSSCYKEVITLQQKIATEEKVPFTYVKGKKKEKSSFKSKNLTVLNWNVCLFDSNLSLLFGGVRPWSDRMGQIVEKIKSADADIVCLQEVFSQSAGKVLLEKLRSQYAHFYVQIGPNLAGFCLETLGIPSGLFVASKYPLKDAQFTPYIEGQTPPYRGYGFFSADIYNRKKCLGRLVATHLQPGYTKEDAMYRAAQMKAITASLQSVEQPVFLCGDLNIEKNSEEAEIFQLYHASTYRGLNWTCCELRNYWWKAKQDIADFCGMPLEKEWLDYFFCLNKFPDKTFGMQTDVRVVNDLDHPEEALSDHQMLLTKISFQ